MGVVSLALKVIGFVALSFGATFCMILLVESLKDYFDNRNR